MTKKKSQRDVGTAFGLENLDTAPPRRQTAAEASNEILDIPEAPAGFQMVNSDRIRYIDIFNIQSDLRQPRRTIPYTLGRLPATEDLPAFLKKLAQLAVANVPALLETETDADRPQPLGAAESALFTLTDLAASIRQDGLLNAITVVESGHGSYMIETGERRWLAYHLLYATYGSEPVNYRLIPARVMPEHDVWRQSMENNVRENLNAIARARQFALLLMDLYGMRNFQPMETFTHEQLFYAQVSDGQEWRIPRGKTEKMLVAMGLKSDVQLRQYRALLRLPLDVWILADDRNIPESVLRDAVLTAGDDNKWLLRILREYGALPSSPDRGFESGGTNENFMSPDQDPAEVIRTRIEAFWRDFYRFRQKQQRFIEKAQPEERTQAILALRQMIEDIQNR